MTEHPCKNCLADISHLRSDAEFCSENCRDVWHRHTGQLQYKSGIPKSGVPGVTYCTKLRHWRVKHKKLYLCMKKTLEEAIEAKERHRDLMLVCRATAERAKELLIEEMKDAR